MVIQGKVGVPICGLRMIAAEHSLLQYDAFSLQVDGLEEVSKLELNTG